MRRALLQQRQVAREQPQGGGDILRGKVASESAFAFGAGLLSYYAMELQQEGLGEGDALCQ